MKHLKGTKVIISLLAIVCILFTTSTSAQAAIYYKATDEAKAALVSNEKVDVNYVDDKLLVFKPEAPKAGFIFYPGGSVQYESYAPLMQSLAQQGILCVIVHMPLNFAVFDVNAADGIQDKFPEIDKWYIGGHSLGGSMAATYVSKHVSDYDGLILLAGFSTSDISKSGLKVISLYGSNDKVLVKPMYNLYRKKLPEDTVELVIEGGCHAQFGCYGKQSGDGEPTISGEEQRAITTKVIVDTIF